MLGRILEKDFCPPESPQGQLSTTGEEWFLVDTIAHQDGNSFGRKLNIGRVCEAWFYAGMKRLAAGDKRTAIELFKKCLATDQKTFVEFGLAATELKMLGDNQDGSSASAVRNALQP